MAVKSKTNLGKEFTPGKPKKTRQGKGQHSKPKGDRKVYRGQGK